MNQLLEKIQNKLQVLRSKVFAKQTLNARIRRELAELEARKK